MMQVTVHLMGVHIKLEGSKTQRKNELNALKSKVYQKDLRPVGPWEWKLKNPYKYAEKIPQVAVALEDVRRQLPMFSAKELAGTQDQKYAEFFFYLTLEEQMIIMECAYEALRYELTDGLMRERRLLDIDVSDEYLQPVYDKLDKFLGAE